MSFVNFCPNCFQTDSFKGYRCYLCGYEEKGEKDKRALAQGTWLHRRYLVGKVLGIGGFGITYLVFDCQSRQRFAVKEYFPAEWAMRTVGTNVITSNSQSKDQLYTHGRNVFVNEAEILRSLQTDQNIVNVKDFFVENGTAYMVMEYLEGHTFGTYMKGNGGQPVSVDLANRMMKEIGESLCRIHGHMLLHRDISPDNVMLTKKDEIKLIDFGSTRIYALNTPKSMSVLIKPGFAPIEQYSRTGRQGPWTDIYALAATYYYLTSGHKPPTAPDRMSGEKLIPLKQWNVQVSEKTSQAITRAMSVKWENRPYSVRQFLSEMDLERRQKENLAEGSPHLILQMSEGMHRWAFKDGRLRIGRNAAECDIQLVSGQISGLHCIAEYDVQMNKFRITNFSANRTYTGRGILEKGQFVSLEPGEWFYLQTSEQRYVFYLEVI